MAVDNYDLLQRLQEASRLLKLPPLDDESFQKYRIIMANEKIDSVISDLTLMIDDGK